VQKVLHAGFTGISCPGGSWFTDVGVRDAIRLGVMEGPRVHCAGRMIITYGSIEDDEPSWVGTPDHGLGVMCNTVDEMVTEVRRQAKHGVNFIKMADSRSGDVQTIARDEIAAVVQEAHRRKMRVAIHSRGAGSTRAAAEAGVDWIIHADLATEADLEAVARRSIPIIPTMTFLATVVEASGRYGQDVIQMDVTRMKRHFEGLVGVVALARKMGIRILAGTDTGNNTFMPYGEMHAKEIEIFVRYCDFTPMEAIVTATRENAFALGLEGELGLLQPGKLADVVIWNKDPLADIRVLQSPANIAQVVKDGRIVARSAQPVETLEFQHALA
jgi:imidazolonepropionase-like amidohydrolase